MTRTHDTRPGTLPDRLHRLHQVLLGTGVGERTRSLLHGMSWTIPAAFVSRLLAGLATIFAARWIGPAEYGKANLALAITAWMQVPLFLGIPTAILHFAPQSERNEKWAWLHDGMMLLWLIGGFTLITGYVFRNAWSSWAGVSTYIFELSLIWCAGYLIYTIAITLLTAQENFRARAWNEIGFAVFFAITIAGIWLLHHLDGSRYLLALSGVYALVGGWALWVGRLPKNTVPIPSSYRKRSLLRYGTIAAVGGVASALFNASGRLVANRHISLTDVGLLSAYQSGSIQMALFLLTPMAQVFFPIASRTPDKGTLLKKISRVLFLSLFISAPAFAFLMTIYFAVLGKGYTAQSFEIGIFAIAAAFTLTQGLYTWFLAAQGEQGLLACTAITLVAGAANYLGCLALIPTWKILGAAVSYAASAAVGTLGCYLYSLWRANGSVS